MESTPLCIPNIGLKIYRIHEIHTTFYQIANNTMSTNSICQFLMIKLIMCNLISLDVKYLANV